MNCKFLTSSGLILFCIQSLFSQAEFLPSLIVSHQNDTIYGVGNMSKNQEHCLFKSIDEEEYLKYYPDEINVFRIIGGKYYVSREITESNGKVKWYFLEFLVDGEIDLFAITSSGRYFIKKENEHFLELNDNIESVQAIKGKDYLIQDKRHLGYIRAYMSETPELFPKIDKMGRLSQRDLVNLSVDYHYAVCDEGGCVNYTKRIPKVTYKFELISGVTCHNNYYAPQVGFLVHIWRPLKNEKLYLKTGILYSDRPDWKKDYYKEDKYDYSIKFPVSFQYVFGRKDFKPTISIGFPTGIFPISSCQGGFIYSFSRKFELSFSGSVDGLLSLPLGEHRNLYNSALGHTLSFGLIYNLN